MLKKLIPIAATFVVTAIVVTIAILGAESMAQDIDPGLPYNVDGTWTPEYFPVSDSEGNTVGVVPIAGRLQLGAPAGSTHPQPMTCCCCRCGRTPIRSDYAVISPVELTEQVLGRS